MENRRLEKGPLPPKNVIIVGGSLSALMHGLMLHRLGSSVRILEQSSTDTPNSHFAGLGMGPDIQRFMKRFDRISEVPIGTSSTQLQTLDPNGVSTPFLQANRILSSWEALYFRLRANFDLLASEYIPHPPALIPLLGEDEDGALQRARYECGKQVTGIEELASGQLLVRYNDHANEGRESEALADLVLGADGPSSIVRRICLGSSQADRKYAGYVAWRGAVPESQLSQDTAEIFRANITVVMLPGEGGHMIIYNIPGKGGSIEPGKCLVNVVWYTNVPESSLDEIMTDVHGRRCRTKVSPEDVRPEVWEKQKALGKTCFSGPLLEIFEQIPSPFLHLITDYCSPRMSFAGGKILLVGDAATLLRPHLALSTNQAACHALLTEKLLTGQVSLNKWEYQVSKAGYLQWARSVWFGEYYQRPLYVSIRSAVVHWTSLALTKMRVWMGWLSPPAV